MAPSSTKLLTAEQLERFFADGADTDALLNEFNNVSDPPYFGINNVEGFPIATNVDSIKSEADDSLSLLSGSRKSSPHSVRLSIAQGQDSSDSRAITLLGELKAFFHTLI